MGFFEWLSQLRMTPAYSVLIAAVFTPLITGLVAYATLRHQRRLAGREHNERRRLALEDRDDKRYEKLLDEVAELQPMVVPCRHTVANFGTAVWCSQTPTTNQDHWRTRVQELGPDTLKSVSTVQQQLAVVYLRALNQNMLAIASAGSAKCGVVYRLVEEFVADAKIGIRSANDHEVLAAKLNELLNDLDGVLRMARERLDDTDRVV